MAEFPTQEDIAKLSPAGRRIYREAFVARIDLVDSERTKSLQILRGIFDKIVDAADDTSAFVPPLPDGLSDLAQQFISAADETDPQSKLPMRSATPNDIRVGAQILDLVIDAGYGSHIDTQLAELDLAFAAEGNVSG